MTSYGGFCVNWWTTLAQDTGVISPRFDVGVKEIEPWTARLLPSRQTVWLHRVDNFGWNHGSRRSSQEKCWRQSARFLLLSIAIKKAVSRLYSQLSGLLSSLLALDGGSTGYASAGDAVHQPSNGDRERKRVPSYSLESKLGDCFKTAKIRREAVQKLTGSVASYASVVTRKSEITSKGNNKNVQLCLACDLDAIFSAVFSGERMPYSPAKFLYRSMGACSGNWIGRDFWRNRRRRGDVYKQGKGPIDVIKTGLTGWDQDQLEVRQILDKYGFKSIFAYTPGSGRGMPIRFNPRNGRSMITYRDGAVVYVDGEPKAQEDLDKLLIKANEANQRRYFDFSENPGLFGGFPEPT
ncbi:hypothetical protein CASFOL_020168 [Castilleja foliolosa]|uniref:Uncharacterized protein n=1 Tax=Castilleja foliolosa TaxID=1961234 RepID=A0ABD3D3M7_9LAMI